MTEDETPSLSKNHVIDKFWRFHRKDGMITSENLFFREDSTIGGYSHFNEKFWEIKEGILRLQNAQKIDTVIFNNVDLVNGLLVLSGAHIPNPNIILCLSEQIGRNYHNSTKLALHKEIENLGWSVGDHTYGVPLFIEKGMSKLHIGKYCSIATGVKISFGDHKTSSISTYPFRSLKKYWGNVPDRASDHTTKGDVNIGNDVWIGTDAFISSGVTIGDGAVIGARAVVTKDVAPYTIVAGCPAKFIRSRFEDDTVQLLLKAAWWSLSDEDVDAIIPFLLSTDVEQILQAVDDIRGRHP